jgi:hypothetical protein
MSNKVLLKFVVAFGTLVVVLIFLGMNYVPRISALSSANENGMAAVNYVGSDYIERHPAAVVRAANYTGSDYIERHPSSVARPVIYAGSDYIERHTSNYYDNSDWIERHAGQRNP